VHPVDCPPHLSLQFPPHPLAHREPFGHPSAGRAGQAIGVLELVGGIRASMPAAWSSRQFSSLW
jgi:hypothetical protein